MRLCPLCTGAWKLSEKRLILSLKKGELSAYEQAFHLYYPKYVRFAGYVLGDLAVAKDLMQNVFMKLWKNRDRLREDLSLENFLYVLTKHEILNYLRSKKEYEPLAGAAEEKVSGEGEAERAADVSLVLDSVGHLPSQRKKVFVMSRLQGFSNKEIAQSLSISEKTVERHITLAGKQIRDEMKE